MMEAIRIKDVEAEAYISEIEVLDLTLRITLFFD